MRNDTPQSPVRKQARELVHAVIQRHVHGPAQCLARGDVLLLRRELRAACPWNHGPAYALRIWREEVRLALGYRVRRPKRKPASRRLLYAEEIMPAMREWAEQHGIVAPAP